VEEAVELEKGVDCDIVQDLPPWSLELDASGKRTREVSREIYTDANTKKNRAKGKFDGRKVLVANVRFLPIFMFAFDGATKAGATGVSVMSKHPDPFTDELDDDMGHLHEICVLKKGQTLTDLAERISPGCSDPSHHDHWLISYVRTINDHSYHSELQAVTREPARREPPAMGVGKNATAAARRVAGQINDQSARDGRTDTRMPYKDDELRRLKYDHKSQKPGIDGGAEGAATRKARGDCWVRMPVIPAHYERELPNATWYKPRAGRPAPPPAHTLLRRMSLCILHAAMRTIESCLTQMLLLAQDKYKGNKKADVNAVNTHLNEYLRDRLGLRKLVSVNDKGELNKVQINGNEVKVIYEDLTTGKGHLLKAVKKMYAELNLRDEVTKVNRWEVALTAWALAMQASFKMRPTAADRQIFRENAKVYVMEKSKIRAGITTWYDWQMYSIFTVMFDEFESLRLVCQEGMEGYQKRQNMFLRLCNNFSNAGRIPWAVKVAGEAVRLAYMKARKLGMKSPVEWLWTRNVMGFFAEFSEVIELAQTLKAAGNTVDWVASFVPSWYTFMVCRKITGRYRAWAKIKNSPPAPARTVSWKRRDDSLNPEARPWLMGIRQQREEASPTFSVRAKTVYGEGLAEELAAYYAPVPCEDKLAADIDGETARRLIQRERRKRWKNRVQA